MEGSGRQGNCSRGVERRESPGWLDGRGSVRASLTAFAPVLPPREPEALAEPSLAPLARTSPGLVEPAAPFSPTRTAPRHTPPQPTRSVALLPHSSLAMTPRRLARGREPSRRTTPRELVLVAEKCSLRLPRSRRTPGRESANPRSARGGRRSRRPALASPRRRARPRSPAPRRPHRRRRLRGRG